MTEQALQRAAPKVSSTLERIAEAEGFSAEDLKVLKAQIAPNCSDAELGHFMKVCAGTGLSPFTRQIYAIMRRQKVGGEWVEKMTIQAGIDGFRATAASDPAYNGQDGPWWYDADGQKYEVWLKDEKPAAARVGVYLKGQANPVWGVATWREFCQTDRDGKPTGLWKTLGPTMIAKCAEAQALRKACPRKLSGIYISEEMDQADSTGPQASYGEHVEPRTDRALPSPTAIRPDVQVAPPEQPAITVEAAIDDATPAAPAGPSTFMVGQMQVPIRLKPVHDAGVERLGIYWSAVEKRAVADYSANLDALTAEQLADYAGKLNVEADKLAEKWRRFFAICDEADAINAEFGLTIPSQRIAVDKKIDPERFLQIAFKQHADTVKALLTALAHANVAEKALPAKPDSSQGGAGLTAYRRALADRLREARSRSTDDDAPADDLPSVEDLDDIPFGE